MFKYHLKRKIIQVIKFFSHHLGIKKFDPKIKSDSVFVVGCSHSGTTLLTTILGRHDEIFAIGEETYVFGQSTFYAKSAIHQWDILCRQFGKRMFLEKTPKHVYEIRKIFKLLPDARVIFLVRNPIDNIASLVKRNGSLEKSVNKWTKDNKNLLKFKSDPRVHICYYDLLVKDPAEEVKNICRFLDINYSSEMIDSNKSPFTSWKNIGKEVKELRYKQVTKSIKDNRGKGKELFDRKDLDLIETETKKLSEKLGIPGV